MLLYVLREENSEITEADVQIMLDVAKNKEAVSGRYKSLGDKMVVLTQLEYTHLICIAHIAGRLLEEYEEGGEAELRPIHAVSLREYLIGVFKVPAAISTREVSIITGSNIEKEVRWHINGKTTSYSTTEFTLEQVIKIWKEDYE